MTAKRCSRCGETKPLDAFHRHPTTKDRRQSQCAVCGNLAQQESYARHRETVLARQRSRYDPEKSRARRLRADFGLSIDEYEMMLVNQGGVCLICGAVPTRKRLHVDHDHLTGRVRGLLCDNCNLAIGLLHDDPKRARAVASYLEGEMASV